VASATVDGGSSAAMLPRRFGGRGCSRPADIAVTRLLGARAGRVGCMRRRRGIRIAVVSARSGRCA